MLISFPLVTKSQSARFEGQTSYRINLDSNTAVVATDKVTNIHSRTTGQLTIQLFLCEGLYEGGTLKGIPCGEVVIVESLKNGEQIQNFRSGVSFTRPLNGSFFPVILLLEKVKGENVIIDFVTFDEVGFKKKSKELLIGQQP
ncbi:MAG: hypothetical protein A2W93_16125 [Bacteroidetes bacterium GWF2_43_63]|nr:MAG: hypothetical protein A2W93_16125 [Bacteroidetes bacterium GWF2_43_63]